MTRGGYPDGAQQPGQGEPRYPPPQYPQYGQPQYGQPQYGQPQYGQQPVRRRFGVVGALIASVGAVLVLIAFLGPNWLDRSHTRFSDVRRALDAGDVLRATTTAHDYFNWLGWVLLVLCALLALMANLPLRISRALRIVGGIIGVLATLYAAGSIKLSYAADFSEYFKHAGPGYFLAIAGFVLLTAGAVIGARPQQG